MTEQQARALVTTMAAVYPRTELTIEQFKAFADMISDLDADEARQVVDQLCRSSKWFPSVAEIRCGVAVKHLHAAGISMFVNAEQAWAYIVDQGRPGDDLSRRAWVYDAHAMRQASPSVLDGWRRDFEAIYRELLALAVQETAAAEGARDVSSARFLTKPVERTLLAAVPDDDADLEPITYQEYLERQKAAETPVPDGAA